MQPMSNQSLQSLPSLQSLQFYEIVYEDADTSERPNLYFENPMTEKDIDDQVGWFMAHDFDYIDCDDIYTYSENSRDVFRALCVISDSEVIHPERNFPAICLVLDTYREWYCFPTKGDTVRTALQQAMMRVIRSIIRCHDTKLIAFMIDIGLIQYFTRVVLPSIGVPQYLLEVVYDIDNAHYIKDKTRLHQTVFLLLMVVSIYETMHIHLSPRDKSMLTRYLDIYARYRKSMTVVAGLYRVKSDSKYLQSHRDTLRIIAKSLYNDMVINCAEISKRNVGTPSM